MTGHNLHASAPSQALVASTPARNPARAMAKTTTAVSDGETSRSIHFWRSDRVPTCMWRSSLLALPFESKRSSGEGRVQFGVVEQVVDGVAGEAEEAREKMEGR